MRLTQQDASFIYTETASGPMQTAGIFVLDQGLSFDRVLEHYRKRIHLVPRLRQRLVFVPMNLGHPKWVDDPDFNIENHVVHLEAPADCTMARAIDMLCDANEGVMDRSIPLWKFVVLTGVRDRTLILQQIHHAMIDGASAVHMSTLLFDMSRDAPDPEPEPGEWHPPPIPTAMALLTESLQENMRPPDFGALTRALSSAGNRGIVQHTMEAMARFVTEPVVMAPWNASLIGPRRRIAYSIYDFSEFREIRGAFGGTINDIALTMVSEGAARYLAFHGERTENQKLRVMCPVNVRTENESGSLGNRVSAIFPTMPAYVMDVLERYEEVKRETERIKLSREAQGMTLLMESAPAIPPVAMAAAQLVGTPFDFTRPQADFPVPVLPALGGRGPNFGVNFVLTNVPGVQVPQFIAGAEVIEQTAIMMMGGNMGLGVVVGSYNQKMIYSFTVDPRLVPDPEKLDEFTAQAFKELLAAARAGND